MSAQGNLPSAPNIWTFHRRIVRSAATGPINSRWVPDPQFLDTRAIPPAAETKNYPLSFDAGVPIKANDLSFMICVLSYQANGLTVPWFTSAMLFRFEALILMRQGNPDDRGTPVGNYPTQNQEIVISHNSLSSMFAGYVVPWRFSVDNHALSGQRIFPRFDGVDVNTDDPLVEWFDVYVGQN